MMREMGMTGQMPLGDMDDVLNITNDKVQAGDQGLYRWLAERYQAQRIWQVHSELTQPPGTGKRPVNVLLQIAESAPGGIVWREESRATFADRAAADQAVTGPLLRALLEKISERWVSGSNPGLAVAAGAAPGTAATTVAAPAESAKKQLRLRHAAHMVACAAVMKRLQTLPGMAGWQVQQLSAYETVLQIDYRGQDNQLLSALTDMGTKAEATAEGMVAHIP
jgi:hypothetical protein